jgi:hypothetical protein
MSTFLMMAKLSMINCISNVKPPISIIFTTITKKSL